MKKSFKTTHKNIRTSTTLMLMFTLFSLALFSFTVRRVYSDELLKQLGISKTAADEKISRSILGGYIDAYGLKNIRNIAAGNRTALTMELLQYTRKYLESPEFNQQYQALRDSRKPQLQPLQTPEEMQQEIIESAKKSISELETNMKTADESTKEILKGVLETVKKQLKDMEDPKNPAIEGYRSGYPSMLKSRDEMHRRDLAAWEQEYPENSNGYIKLRLQQFMQETSDIDFDAALYEKNGRQYFSNKAYEAKSNRWKMAFRAGKEVVIPSRKFVSEWMNSLP